MNKRLETTREMKDSGIEWIGDIPKDWDLLKLSYGLKIINGYSFKSELYSDSGMNVIRITNIENGKVVLKNPRFYPLYYQDTIGNAMLSDGDLLMTLTGDVGCVGLIEKKHLPAGLNQRVACLRIFNVSIEPKYLYYLFNNSEFVKIATENSNGTAQLNLSTEWLKSLKIPLPPLHEQQAISNYLDEQVGKIDELISDQKVAIEKWKEYKQSLITETVTKGLNPDVEMKDSGVEWIGEIPSDWEIKKAKYLIKFRTGLSITKNDFVDIGCKTINYGQIHSKYTFDLDLTRDELFKVNIEYAESNPLTILKEGDFVFCDTSEDLDGCGNCVLVENTNGELLLAGSHTTIGRAKYPYISRYMAYLFKSENFRVQIRSSVSGIKVFSITQKILNNTYLIIPSLQEQRAIADYLDEKCSKIDQTIEQKQELIKQLEEYKQSLIYECVTGKREVR